MTIHRRYMIPVDIIVDNEDEEVIKKLDERYADGRMIKTATHGVISNIVYRGKAGLHRGILARSGITYEKGYHCDHINNNNGDNRSENLQVLSASENQRKARDRKKSASQYYGVYWDKRRNKWKSIIAVVGRRNINLGNYANEVDAAKAYDSYVYFNNLDRKPNFPDSTEETHKQYVFTPKITSSQYYGVSWYKKGNKWKSQIHINKATKYIGSFTDEVEAARAYDEKVKELKLDKKLNFPDNDENGNDRLQVKETKNDQTASTPTFAGMGTD